MPVVEIPGVAVEELACWLAAGIYSRAARANYNYQYEPAVANHLMFREFFLLNVV
jgi:hypothetical protein